MSANIKHKQPPQRIYLQWYGSSGPDDLGKVCETELTWSADRIFKHDFVYVRVKRKKHRKQ